MLDDDRFFPADPTLRQLARNLFKSIRKLPLISPHGHTEPRWFAENLRYRTPDSRCYENDEANCEDQGRLYRLEDAFNACPAGWRVPSEDHWRALERWLGIPYS